MLLLNYEFLSQYWVGWADINTKIWIKKTPSQGGGPPEVVDLVQIFFESVCTLSEEQAEEAEWYMVHSEDEEA